MSITLEEQSQILEDMRDFMKWARKTIPALQKQHKSEPSYIGIHEAAEILGVSVATMYKYNNQTKIPYRTDFGKCIYKRSDIVKCLECGIPDPHSIKPTREIMSCISPRKARQAG